MYWKVWGVNAVKTLKFEKVGMTPPPAPMVAPPLTPSVYSQVEVLL